MVATHLSINIYLSALLILYTPSEVFYWTVKIFKIALKSYTYIDIDNIRERNTILLYN